MKVDAATLIRRTGKLPSLPEIYAELVRVVDDPNSTIDTISVTLRKDPSLAARLLKLANSAFYGVPAQIGTVEEAVQLIGLREIKDLVMATSVIRAFDKLPVSLVDAHSFWYHSIACGLASAMLAQDRHDPAPERFFVGGLLHDIGHLILYLWLPEESLDILRLCEKTREPCTRVEMNNLGFDHALLGGELIANWRLPPSLREMVACHHHPANSRLAPLDVFTVHYADFLTTALEFGNSGESLVLPLNVPASCQNFLLEDYQLETWIDKLEAQCSEIFPMLTRDSHA